MGEQTLLLMMTLSLRMSLIFIVRMDMWLQLEFAPLDRTPSTIANQSRVFVLEVTFSRARNSYID